MQINRPDLMLVFDLALETGMRLSEIYTLEWDQVDLERRTIFLDKTKNGHKRQVPLSSVAHKRLSEQVDRDGAVFGFGERGAKTSAKLSRRFTRIFEKAGAF